MKYRILLLCLLFPFLGARAANTVNLTPKPKSISVKTGSYALPATMTVGVASLPDSIVNEAQLFTEMYALETGLKANVTTESSPDISLVVSTSMADEAYKLTIESSGITITATTTAGFFYAFQTILKIVQEDKTLPCCVINDAPRFGYRGFMLDVARHFFSAAEVKRFIDLMARYKLNAFHWHLTDDQGWRIPIDKYPKLTTVGATAPNCRMNDMTYGTWMSNAPYGPYYYTKEEIADVVVYANARHIDIIPEVDMPGHFTAAMAAYPEYSCTPNAAHTVEVTGGIFQDVLNVGNPAAVQFAKDILSEVMQLFPTSRFIHIGGDECPVTAWQSNDDCKTLMTKLGIDKPRQLQSWFTREIGKFLIQNGRRPVVWNESVTAENSNLDWVKEVNPVVFSWFPAENGCKTAANLGLQTMMTSYYHYYICRGQEPPMTNASVAGGTSNPIYTKTTYNYDPTSWGNATQLKLMTGVQGTFWTEHVVDSCYLEWLALPRLFAVAEAGWSPASSKNYSDFLTRFAADTTWLNRHQYQYCPNTIASSDDTEKVMPSENSWYRIVNRTTDARKDRCIELLQEGSELITTYSANSAQAGRLWTNAQADSTASNYDLQLWTVEPSPSGNGKYALVCKAYPDGSVNPTPTSANPKGRWDYDYDTKHYNFVLGEQAYGESSGSYYYTIRSDKTTGVYMNSSLAGQGFAVNLYSSPNDGNCGQWTFVNISGTETATTDKYDEFGYLVEGKNYRFTNITGGNFQGNNICEETDDKRIHASTERYSLDAWRAVGVQTNDDNSQTMKLQNAVTGHWVSSATQSIYGSGKAITYTENEADAAIVTLSSTDGELTVKADSLTLFLGLTSASQANTPDAVAAAVGAVRPQGTAWSVEAVNFWQLNCVDTEGNLIGIYYVSLPEGESIADNAEWPQPKNHEFVAVGEITDNLVTLTYKRSVYSITFDCYTDQGVYIGQTEATQTSAAYTVSYPELPYYTFQSAPSAEGTELTLTSDTTLVATYQTDAYMGVEKVMEPVSEITSGHSYLIYDATTVSGRSGYRYISDANSRILQADDAEPATPYYTWTLTKSGTAYTVGNDITGKYVPELSSGSFIVASSSAGKFTFSPSADGTWSIRGSNGLYWNGNAGSLTGWSAPHPYLLYTYQARPYYSVAVVYQTADGTELQRSETIVVAGEQYILYAPETIDSTYTLTSIAGNDGTESISKHTVITLKYAPAESDAVASPAAERKTTTNSIYDLTGRRVAHPRRGLYIVNGRKVVVR